MPRKIKLFFSLIFLYIFSLKSSYANKKSLRENYEESKFYNGIESVDSLSSDSDTDSVINPDVLDWKTFDKSKRVCLAKHSFAKINPNKIPPTALGGFFTGYFGVSVPMLVLPVSGTAFVIGFFAPWVGVPIMSVGGYYGYKHHKQNIRQKQFLQIAFDPEKEVENIYKMFIYAHTYNGVRNISKLFVDFFEEAMKKESYFCNPNGSLKSIEKSYSFLGSYRYDESNMSENMLPIERDLSEHISTLIKYRNSIYHLKVLIKNNRNAKIKHKLNPKNEKNKEDMLQWKQDLSKNIMTLKEKGFLPSTFDKKSSEVLSYLKSKEDTLFSYGKKLVSIWIDEKGNKIAQDQLLRFQDELSTYPQLSMKKKFKRWKNKKFQNDK